MRPIELERTVHAPLPRVFSVVGDVREYARAVEEIVRLEFLGERHRGLGTRVRVTRRAGKREVTETLEVVAFAEDDSLRLVHESAGTRWETGFSVREGGGATRLLLHVTAHSDLRLVRWLHRLMRRYVTRAMEQELEKVRAYCESSAS